MAARHPGSRYQRGSSPPTQVLLRPSERDDAEIADLDLSKIDEDPITYFLTPAHPAYDEDDAMDFEMDFDAGIEDAKHPPPIVRSVSPSSLDGLSIPPPRSPPRRSVSPDTDRDMPPTPEDGEDYIRLAVGSRPHPFGLPLSLRDLTGSKFKKHDKPSSGKSDKSDVFVLPPRSSSQGRTGRVVRRGRPRTATLRRSPHAWREPSPDVWSIEEETEEELNSEMGDSVMEGDGSEFSKIKGIDIPAAKPKKRVRFVLPDEESGGFP